MTPRVVPGRWPAAALAVVGALLALPSLLWPVLVVTIPTGDASSPDFVQGFWSWGKFADITPGHDGSGFELPGTAALVLLALSLMVGVGGAAAWALVGREPGRSAGVAGVSVAATVQLILSAQWMERRQSFWIGETADNPAEIHLTGWLQLSSVVLLLVALGFMLRRPMRAFLASSWRHLHGVEPASETAVVHADEQHPTSTPMGSAQMLEVNEQGGRSGPLDGPPVGFSDGGNDRDRDARGSEPSG